MKTHARKQLIAILIIWGCVGGLVILSYALKGHNDIVTITESSQNTLLSAIIQVESGGDPNAIGDGGRAVGILQIHPIMVKDVNRILGHERYTLEDRYSPEKSIEMFWIYTNHYSPHESDEVVARRWNGGPKGDTKPSTVRYWERVRSIRCP